jgi:outer membrane protein TolC
VVTFSQPIFDSGQRSGQKRVREASYNVSRLALTGLQIQARSEVRLAQETVRRSERALAALRSATDQANEVLKITTFASKQALRQTSK